MVWLVFFPLKIRKVGHIGDIGHVVYAHCSFLLLKLVGHTDQVGHADHIFTQILFFPSANCFHLSLFCPIRSLIWKDYSKFPQKSTFRGHVLIWISNWCLRCYLPRVDLFGNRAILIIDIKIPFDCKLGRASKFDFFLEKMKKRQRSHRCYSHFRWCFVMTIIHFKIKLQAGHQINIVYMHDYWINITCANMDSKDPLIAIPGHRLIHLLNPIGQDLALGLSQGCCRQLPGGQQMFFCLHCRRCHCHLVHPWRSLESEGLHLTDSTVIAQDPRHWRLSHLKDSAILCREPRLVC